MTTALVIGSGVFTQAAPAGEWTPDRPCAGFRDLLSVEPAVTQVARELSRLTGTSLFGGRPLLHPDQATAEAAWQAAVEAAAERAESLVVHLAGHGLPAPSLDDSTSLYVPVRDTNPGRLPGTAIRLHQWLEEIEHTADAPATLFLVDVCGGGRAALHQLSQRLGGAERKAWVIAACTAQERAYAARFSCAVAAVLRRLRSGGLDISPGLAHVPLETLAGETDRELARAVAGDPTAYRQTVVLTPRFEASLEPPPFFANPGHATGPAGRLQGRMDAALWQFAKEVHPVLDPVHFITRASGVSRTAVAQGCLFSGRATERAALTTWLDDPGAGALFVVTGSPGVGKSALLGVQVCLAHPELRQVAGGVRSRIPLDQRPRENPRMAAVHARQRSQQEVIDSLAHQLRLGPLPGSARWNVERILEVLAGQKEPAVLVLDALDEALHPATLLDEVLLPLAAAIVERADKDGGTRSRRNLCRVLIGTRPWWEQFPQLRQAVTAGGGMLDLDQADPVQATQDMGEYLQELLWTSPPYASLPKQRATVATELAAAISQPDRHGGYLLAYLYADYLGRLEEPLSGQEAAAQLPPDLPAMLDMHLSLLAVDEPWLRQVLAATAHAQGDGMPLALVHEAALALRAADDQFPAADAPADPVLDDTREALDSESAAFYLRGATDVDGRRLYRLFHHSLVEHLRDRGAAHNHPLAERIWERLVSTVPGPPGTRAWHAALPYLHRHAADHAPAAALDGLLLDPAFLVHAEPGALTGRLAEAGSPAARAHAAVYRSSTGHHRMRQRPEARRQLLALDAVRWGRRDLAAALEDVPTEAAAAGTAVWATNGTVQPALRTDLACPAPEAGDTLTFRVADIDGRPHAVTCDDSGRAHAWDLSTARLRTTITMPLFDRVLHTLTTPDGRALAVAGHPECEDGVNVWDLATGVRPYKLDTSRAARWEVTGIDGEPHLVTSTPARVSFTTTTAARVSLFNLSDGTRRTFEVREPYVQAVDESYAPGAWLVGPEHSRTLVIAGAGGLVLCDPADSGRQAVIPLAGAQTHAVSSAVLPDGRTVLVICGGGMLMVCDVGTRAVLWTARTYCAPVSSSDREAATARAFERRDLAATVWGSAAGEPHGRLHTATRDPNYAHVVRVGTVPYLVARNDDSHGTWSLRDLVTGERLGPRTERGPSLVWLVVLDGRPHALVGEVTDHLAFEPPRLDILDLTDGRVRHSIGLTQGERPIAGHSIGGVPHLVTGSPNETIRLWDLSGGQPLLELRHDGWTDAGIHLFGGRPHLVTISTRPRSRVLVWDLLDRTPPPVPVAHRWSDVLLTSDTTDPGAVVSVAGGDPALQLWDLRDGTLRDSWPMPDGAEVVSVTAAGGQAYALVAERRPDGTSVAMRSLHDGLCHGEAFHPAAGQVDALALATGGTCSLLTVADAAEEPVRVWEVPSGRLLHVLPHPGLWLDWQVADIAGRTHLLTAAEDPVVRIWDPATGHLRAVFGHPGSGRVQAQIAGTRLFTCNLGKDNRHVRVWDTATGTCLSKLEHPGPVRIAAVAGRHLVTISPSASGLAEYEVRVWRTDRGTETGILRVPALRETGPLTDLSVEPLVVPAPRTDSGLLLTWTQRRTDRSRLEVWDAADAGRRAVIHPGVSAAGLHMIAVAGRQLAITWGPGDPCIKLWALPDGTASVTVRHGLGDNVTVDVVTRLGRPWLVVHSESSPLIRMWDPSEPAARPVELWFPEPVHSVHGEESGILVGFGEEAAFLRWRPDGRPDAGANPAAGHADEEADDDGTDDHG